MAVLTIRGLDEKVTDRLKALAKRNGRSTEEQVRRILTDAVVDRAEALAHIEEALQTREPVPYELIEKGIREGRP